MGIFTGTAEVPSCDLNVTALTIKEGLHQDVLVGETTIVDHHTDEMPARFIRQEQHRPVHVLVGVCVCPEPTVNASVGLDDELVSAVLPLDVDHFGRSEEHSLNSSHVK